MSIPQTYYLNGPTLSSATGVFYDANFLVIAPDGYYSDGSITRQQISGSLQLPQPCPTCFFSCPKEFGVISNGTFPTTDVSSVLKYKISIDLGPNVGNSKITISLGTFDLFGVVAKLGTNEYNLIVEPSVTYYKSPVPGFTAISAGACTADSLNPYNVREILYNYTINNWVDSGIVISGETADPSQTFSYVGIQNYLNMFIPKPSATERILNLEIYSFIPCYPVYPITDLYFLVECPAPLVGFAISDTPYLESAFACAATDGDQLVYVASSTGTVPTIYPFDILYYDNNGVNPVAPGWYYCYPDSFTKTAILVDNNGVITNIVTC